MAWFYEIRNSDNAVLKRDAGFATQEAAKTAGLEDAKKMRAARLREGPRIGNIVVGWNTQNPTRT